MSLQKYKPWRSRRYLDWVKSLPCVLTGAPADDPHHAIGVRLSGMGQKAPDWAVMPVSRETHHRLHADPELWPDQWTYISNTLMLALTEGRFTVNMDRKEEFARAIGQMLDEGVLR